MHAPPPGISPHAPSTPAIALALALALLGLLGAGGLAAVNTIRMVPGATVPAQRAGESHLLAVSTPGTVGNGTSLSRPLNAGPGWDLMTRNQKLALYPLAERWDYMTEAQKRRWLTLAETFAAMPEEEQQRLHERMVTWAGLSAQQRSQARLNFATAKSLSPDDIEEQWEAYQALSEMQKNLLAATAPVPRGAATALQPATAKRLAQVPAPTYAQSQSANPPKIVFPAASPVRLPAAAAPVDLAPAMPPEVPAVSAKTGEAPALLPSEPEKALPADPLPPLYIN